MRAVKLGRSHLGMQLNGALQELSCGVEKWESDLLNNLKKNWIVRPRTFRYSKWDNFYLRRIKKIELKKKLNVVKYSRHFSNAMKKTGICLRKADETKWVMK